MSYVDKAILNNSTGDRAKKRRIDKIVKTDSKVEDWTFPFTATTPEEFLTKFADFLLPYQKAIIDDPALLIIIEKSRRIGISYLMAYICVWNCLLNKGDCTYMSYRLKAGRTFIKLCKEHYKNLYKVGALLGMQELKELEHTKNTSLLSEKIKFPNGRTIECVTTSEEGFRGEGRPGEIAIIDEAAHIGEASNNHAMLNSVLEGAQGYIDLGGKLFILSTHNGVENPFNKFVMNAKEGRIPECSVHTITLDDAIDEGYFEKIVCPSKGWEPTLEKREEWRQELIDRYDSVGSSKQELFCVPLRGALVFIPRDLIMKHQSPTASYLLYKAPTDDFHTLPLEARQNAVNEHFEPLMDSLFTELYTQSYIGVDVGRSNDLSSISVGICKDNDDPMICNVIDLFNLPFSEQVLVIALVVSRLQDLTSYSGTLVDRSGLGYGLFESLNDIVPSVSGVHFTQDLKKEVFYDLRHGFNNSKLYIPESADVINDISSLEMDTRGVPTIPVRRVKGTTGHKRHCDSAVAIALSCHLRKTGAYTKPRTVNSNRFMGGQDKPSLVEHF